VCGVHICVHMCLCVFMRVCVRGYVYVCLNARLCMILRVCSCVRMCVCTCMYVCACIDNCKSCACTSACVCTRMFMDVCQCTRMRTCVYVLAHKHVLCGNTIRAIIRRTSMGALAVLSTGKASWPTTELPLWGVGTLNFEAFIFKGT
jgi:hypothetical protein